MQRVLAAERLYRYEQVVAALGRIPDGELAAAVRSATHVHYGIGGTSALVELAGHRVFVKCIALTAMEQEPAYLRSTSNYFGLPPYCHYGIGSPGFGAWREVEMLERSTRALLAGDVGFFPLTYGWRALAQEAPALSEELSDSEAVVAFWGGSSAVGARLAALRDAGAVIAVVQEPLSQDLSQRLAALWARGPDALDRALPAIEQRLVEALAWMGDHGWAHFDMHMENIRVDTAGLYVSDFGLAVAEDFDLEPDERLFVQLNKTYDISYVFAQLARRLVAMAYGGAPEQRDAVVLRSLEGAPPDRLPPVAASMVTKYAPVAAAVMPWYRTVQSVDRAAPYPADAVRSALAPLWGPGTAPPWSERKT